jgi:hypothetical protein
VLTRAGYLQRRASWTVTVMRTWAVCVSESPSALRAHA